jgi:hypothetical protein
MYVLSREQREFIRVDSIKAGTEIAANYRSLAASYLKMGLFDSAQQIAEYAEHHEKSVKQEVIE